MAGFERRDHKSFDRNKRPGGFRDKKPEGMSNGRIENFEKPLLQLLRDINDKLDLLIKNDKEKTPN